jgi:hypothetical protein
LDRRARALRLAGHGDDARQQRVGADPLGAHDQAARRVQRRAGHGVAGTFLDRHRLARDHRLVDRAISLEHHAIDRHFLAGAQAQPVADLDAVERNVLLAPVGANDARLFGREFQQRADRAIGLRPRAQFQHLAEQHQRDDDGARLEIDGGEMAENGDDHAVAIGDAGAERDQGEHVEAAIYQRLPAAHEERRAGPDHHRARQEELQPDKSLRRQRPCDPAAEQIVSHRQQEQRQRQRQRHPESPAHVDQLGVGRLGIGGGDRLQRHAAFGTGARPAVHDLGMHRASPRRTTRCCGRRIAFHRSSPRNITLCQGVTRDFRDDAVMKSD